MKSVNENEMQVKIKKKMSVAEIWKIYLSPRDHIILVLQDKISTLTCTKAHSHSVLVHIVFLFLSVYITDPSPNENCLRQWSIFLSAPLSYSHPHCTYLAWFIFIAIWWILKEKFRTASENHQLWLFTAAVNQKWYIRWETVTQTDLCYKM